MFSQKEVLRAAGINYYRLDWQQKKGRLPRGKRSPTDFRCNEYTADQFAKIVEFFNPTQKKGKR
jgi:hypothetical protein